MDKARTTCNLFFHGNLVFFCRCLASISERFSLEQISVIMHGGTRQNPMNLTILGWFKDAMTLTSYIKHIDIG